MDRLRTYILVITAAFMAFLVVCYARARLWIRDATGRHSCAYTEATEEAIAEIKSVLYEMFFE